jgi:transcriptional regulator with GAF, ATPase, and Fis domain
MALQHTSNEGTMSHADAIPFPAGHSPSPLSSVLEQLAPDICRVLAGPGGESATTPLRTLLARVAEAFGADEACMCCVRGALGAAQIATSERARRLAMSLLEGRWLARQLDEGTPLVLRRGAIDMPPEADHERGCIRAAGVHAVVACGVTAETGTVGYMTIFSRRPLTQWIAPALDQLQMVSTLFGRAALWSSASDLTTLTDVASPAAAVRTPLPLPFDGDSTIVGTSDALRYVLFRVDQVAPTNATVLLLGETGTGKELIARAIHDRSPRHHRSFVVVNCGALPATLIESELFGRERGAFTGAHTSQAGRFELANGGTLFLDEIGELPLELQPNLLRVLQEGQLQRLGSTRTTTVDVRVIAATNRNLAEEVHRGTFRRDLFYRLNVFPITLPALRERREDLPALVHHLVDRLSRQLGKPVNRIRPETLAALEQHDWPGNIRELENVLQQAIILSRDGTLELPGISQPPRDASEPLPLREESRALVDIERDHIRRVLGSTNGRIEGASGAAAVLGLRPSTLRSLMRRLGIERARRPAIGHMD